MDWTAVSKMGERRGMWRAKQGVNDAVPLRLVRILNLSLKHIFSMGVTMPPRG